MQEGAWSGGTMRGKEPRGQHTEQPALQDEKGKGPRRPGKEDKRRKREGTGGSQGQGRRSRSQEVPWPSVRAQALGLGLGDCFCCCSVAETRKQMV